MRKQEFLDALRRKLSGLPQQDVEERLGFYGEMIDDQMEEGIEEETAVAKIGSVDRIASQIKTELAGAFVSKEKTKKEKRRKEKPQKENGRGAWIVLWIVLGAPIGISLAAAAFSVVLSLYVSLWAVVISLWAAFASVAVCAPAGILTGIFFAAAGSAPAGIALISASLVLAGIAVFFFFGCREATRGAVLCIKWMIRTLWGGFRKKEGVNRG